MNVRLGVSSTSILSAFAFGVVIQRFATELVSMPLLLTAVAVAAILSCLQRGFFLLVALLIGLLWANWQGSLLLAASLPKALEGKDLVIAGEVTGVPRHTSQRTQFEFRILEAADPGMRPLLGHKIRLNSYEAIEKVGPRQRWQLVVRLKRPHGFVNPGAMFNYETWLFERRIRATGYVRKNAANILADRQYGGINVSGIREQFSAYIANRFASTDSHALLSALTVGVRHAMTPAQWQTLRKTGTTHLLAISGLHIGLASGLFALICWPLVRRWHWAQKKCAGPKLLSLLAACVGVAYAALAGFTIPTQRALAMLLAISFALVVNRRKTPVQILTLSLVAVLLIDPLAPLSSGFWLSFSAVAILAILIRKAALARDTGLPGKWLYSSGIWIRVQLLLAICMAPLVLMQFGEVSLVSPVGNLLAIPIVSLLVVPLGLLGLVCYFPGWTLLADTLLAIAVFCLDGLMVYLHWLGDFQFSSWFAKDFRFSTLVFAVVGLLIMFICRALPGRSLGIICFLAAINQSPATLPHGAFRYTVLDIGHGLASVVQTANHLLVYDVGSGINSFDAGEHVVVPYLRSLGADRLDKLVISHEHNDHVGGLAGLLRHYQPESVSYGSYLPEQPYRDMQARTLSSCHNQSSWQWDGVTFEFLHSLPAHDQAARGNNASCVLKIRSGGGESVLITGDIEAQVETTLVARYGKELASSVLQVPHQGSKTSSTWSFIHNANPDIAVVSAGYRNRFGHPHEKVVNRYRQLAIPLVSTGQVGAVVMTVSDKVVVAKMRQSLLGYWYNS